MRRAKQTSSGAWRIIEEKGGISRLTPLDWGMDRQGHWPRVEIVRNEFGEKIDCPNCRESILLDDIESVFGVAKRKGADVLFLARCLHCHLPVIIILKGFIHAYPDITSRMEGWSSWEKRKIEFDQEERRLYGSEPPKGAPPKTDSR